jgi:hypothetical protein
MKQNLLALLKKQAEDFKRLADEVANFEPLDVRMARSQISNSRPVAYEEFRGLVKRVALLEGRLKQQA